MRLKLFFMESAVGVFFFLWAGPVGAAESEAAAQRTTYFQRFFVDGGPLVWLILLPLSFVTVGLIVQFFVSIRRARIIPSATLADVKQMAKQGYQTELLERLKGEESFLSRTLYVGLTEAGNGRAAMENAMGEMLERQSTTLLRRIEWLNIIGNVAPMIGLFGTVWGMVEAFNHIVRAHGQPEPDQLAGAISVALLTTLWGLFAAIPALSAYGALRNRIDELTAEVAQETESLLRNFTFAGDFS